MSESYMPNFEAEVAYSDYSVAMQGLYRRLGLKRERLERGEEEVLDHITHLETVIDLIDGGNSSDLLTAAAENEWKSIHEKELQSDMLRMYQGYETNPMTAEQSDAFAGLQGQLQLLLDKDGQSIVIDSSNHGRFSVDDDFTIDTNAGAGIRKARSGHTHTADMLGEMHRVEITMFDNSEPDQDASIASIDIWDTDTSHPATLYKLFANQNVEVQRRYCEDDGIDGHGQRIDPTYGTVSLGYLGSNQIHELRRSLSSATH